MKVTATPRDYEVFPRIEFYDYGTKVALSFTLKSGERLAVAWDMDEGPGIIAAKLRSLAKFLEGAANAQSPRR